MKRGRAGNKERERKREKLKEKYWDVERGGRGWSRTCKYIVAL